VHSICQIRLLLVAESAAGSPADANGLLHLRVTLLPRYLGVSGRFAYDMSLSSSRRSPSKPEPSPSKRQGRVSDHFRPKSFSFVGFYVRTKAHNTGQLAIGFVRNIVSSADAAAKKLFYTVLFFDGSEVTVDKDAHDFQHLKTSFVDHAAQINDLPVQEGDHVEVILGRSRSSMFDARIIDLSGGDRVKVELVNAAGAVEVRPVPQKSQIRHHPVCAPLSLTKHIGSRARLSPGVIVLLNKRSNNTSRRQSNLPSNLVFARNLLAACSEPPEQIKFLVTDVRISSVSQQVWIRVVGDNSESGWFREQDLQLPKLKAVGKHHQLAGRRVLHELDEGKGPKCLATVVEQKRKERGDEQVVNIITGLGVQIRLSVDVVRSKLLRPCFLNAFNEVIGSGAELARRSQTDKGNPSRSEVSDYASKSRKKLKPPKPRAQSEGSDTDTEAEEESDANEQDEDDTSEDEEGEEDEEDEEDSESDSEEKDDDSEDDDDDDDGDDSGSDGESATESESTEDEEIEAVRRRSKRKSSRPRRLEMGKLRRLADRDRRRQSSSDHSTSKRTNERTSDRSRARNDEDVDTGRGRRSRIRNVRNGKGSSGDQSKRGGDQPEHDGASATIRFTGKDPHIAMKNVPIFPRVRDCEVENVASTRPLSTCSGRRSHSFTMIGNFAETTRTCE